MIISTITELRQLISSKRLDKKTIGLVPTMGFLHAGHLSLIEKAKIETDFVVVSDFVNPTQFAPNEDYSSYPRDIEQDEKLAMKAGADVIFHPSAIEMYPQGSSTFVEVKGTVSKVLCARSRPTHFKGVATVVNMLFNIVAPDKAFFGQKDAQQVAVLTKMIADLHQNVEIVVCPIVREKDGLAMSSRNTYLNVNEREQAVVLNEALKLAKKNFCEGTANTAELKKIIIDKIKEKPLANIDYVEIYKYPSMEEIENVNCKTIIAIAVKFGKTRLIDNIILN